MEQEKLKYAESNSVLDVENQISWMTPVRTAVVETDT
jgi:hypothetical protein